MLKFDKLPVPYNNKVLVEVYELPERTESGLFIPETAKIKHRSKEGVIVAVGAGCKLGLAVGDHVYFEEFVGARLYINDKDHLFVVEDAILGVLEER